MHLQPRALLIVVFVTGVPLCSSCGPAAGDDPDTERVAVASLPAAATPSYPRHTSSAYAQLARDRTGRARTTVRQKTFTLSRPTKVVGRFNSVYLWGQDTSLIYFDRCGADHFELAPDHTVG